jgi:hypothetical protein
MLNRLLDSRNKENKMTNYPPKIFWVNTMISHFAEKIGEKIEGSEIKTA